MSWFLEKGWDGRWVLPELIGYFILDQKPSHGADGEDGIFVVVCTQV